MALVPTDPKFRDNFTLACEGEPASHLKASVVSESEEHCRRRLGARSVASAVVLAAIWGEVLADATVRALILGMGAAIGCTLGLMAAAMALGLLGSGLFALFDRASAWMSRAAQWPDE